MFIEKDYYLGFSVFPSIGPVTFRNLLSYFNTAKDAWSASEDQLREVIGEKKTTEFVRFRKQFDIAAYKKRLKETKTTVVTYDDSSYPGGLREVKHPPFVLYVKGNVDILSDKNAIGIVGTRKITTYGKQVTELFTSTLVNAGFMIVSGLALGVDYTAHKTALDSGGKTIAVLGCGVDYCYPSENKNLYEEIITINGAIISEIPLGMPPNKGTFPARNRIIAGLSNAVLVTEGAEDSGALYTAEDAFFLGKPVFAIPGPITSQLSKGPYKLIEKGAKLVTEPEDILKELGVKNNTLRSGVHVKGDTPEEQMIIDLLANEPLLFDDIVRQLSLDSSHVGTLLTMMEVKGFIKTQANGFFSL